MKKEVQNWDMSLGMLYLLFFKFYFYPMVFYSIITEFEFSFKVPFFSLLTTFIKSIYEIPAFLSNIPLPIKALV